MEKDLTDIRYSFKRQKRRGGISEFLLELGGYDGIIKRFGSLTNFITEMKEAGYSKSYRCYVKNKFKDAGY